MRIRIAQWAGAAPVAISLAFGNAALCLFVAAGLGVLTAFYLALGISTMGFGTFYDRRTDPEGYRSSIRLTMLAFVAALFVTIFKALFAN